MARRFCRAHRSHTHIWPRRRSYSCIQVTGGGDSTAPHSEHVAERDCPAALIGPGYPAMRGTRWGLRPTKKALTAAGAAGQGLSSLRRCGVAGEQGYRLAALRDALRAARADRT